MAMKKCPICGEKYSDTYKSCPFCEEEKALRSGATHKRRSGHRVPQNRGPSFLSPLLIILIILMAAVMVYLLFGNKIAKKLGLNETSGITSSSVSSASSSKTGKSKSSKNTKGSKSTDEAVDDLPETLNLSLTDFTMNVGDVPVKVTASGGNSDYTWSSDNQKVATVDEDGNVTAISAGTANITATDGSGKGVCIVRVKGSGTPNEGNQSGSATLNKTDATVGVGENFALQVTGTDSNVLWSVDNSSVATVSGDGQVTGVTVGKTNVTASVDGKKLVCIVRVK